MNNRTVIIPAVQVSIVLTLARSLTMYSVETNCRHKFSLRESWLEKSETNP